MYLDYYGSTATTTSSYYDTICAATDTSSYYTSGTYTGYSGWLAPHEFVRYESVPPTAEELAAQRKQEAEEALAEKTAQDLLIEHLNPENTARFKNKLPIVVPSTIFPDVEYLVKPKRSARIDVLRAGKVIDNICIMPSHINERLPDTDIVLSKVLHLEMNEEECIRVANFANNIMISMVKSRSDMWEDPPSQDVIVVLQIIEEICCNRHLRL